jgi:hypothetical protein
VEGSVPHSQQDSTRGPDVLDAADLTCSAPLNPATSSDMLQEPQHAWRSHHQKDCKVVALLLSHAGELLLSHAGELLLFPLPYLLIPEAQVPLP